MIEKENIKLYSETPYVSARNARGTYIYYIRIWWSGVFKTARLGGGSVGGVAPGRRRRCRPSSKAEAGLVL